MYPNKRTWTESLRDQFAKSWPCCDVPASGWAEFDNTGNLINLSSNCIQCDNGGGLSEFLDDLWNLTDCELVLADCS